MSRPPKKIDWDLVDQMLEAGCPGTEIAGEFAMHPKTFYDKVLEKYKINFTDYSQSVKSKGDGLIRLHQFNKALGKTKKGDTQLLVMLGVERLGQNSPRSIAASQQVELNSQPWTDENNNSI